MILALLAGCAAPEPLGSQPPIQAFLVVHVEPLPRGRPAACESEGWTGCGEVSAESWFRRSQNVRWILEEWPAMGRTLELQVGPEMGLAWAGDEAMTAALAAGFDAADPAAAVREQGEGVRAALGAALGAGAASLGMHVHTSAPDPSGLLGNARLDVGGPHPCDAWAGEPMIEGSPGDVAAVLGYGMEGAGALADAVGADILSFTGHLPRTMAGKIAAIEDPASLGLDPPAAFQPRVLSSAYAECFEQAFDHPALEPWPADDAAALAAGDGPLVLPGERVVGSMSVHLDAASDGAAGAVSRRLLQQLLTWRYAALTGQPGRPWIYTFHVHDYQLEPGWPDEADPGARHDAQILDGQAFRGDVLAAGALLDALAAAPGWQGAASQGEGVVRWALPSEITAEGSRFSYGEPGEPPPEGWDAYPYLPLVAERLAGSHLACQARIDGTEAVRLLRCAGAWGWGAAGAPGYSCDGALDEVYVLVPEADACLAVPGGALRAAPIDAAAMGAPTWCEGGRLAVPLQGLLVEPAGSEPWWPELCE